MFTPRPFLFGAATSANRFQLFHLVCIEEFRIAQPFGWFPPQMKMVREIRIAADITKDPPKP